MLDRSRPVRVFKNWQRGCYSVMQDGVVRASARQVLLRDVEFLVRASGRERMLRLKRKTVHAYAVGYLEDLVHPNESASLPAIDGRYTVYDPYRFMTFVDRDTQQPVLSSHRVLLAEDGVVYVPAPLPQAA